MESWLEFILFLSLTYPHVFLWCLSHGLSRWKSGTVLPAGHLKLKPPSVRHFLTLSSSKLTCSFLFTQSKTRSICWFLTCSWCCWREQGPYCTYHGNFCWLKWNRGADFLTHTHTNCKPKQGTKHQDSRFPMISFKRDRLLLYFSRKLWFACVKLPFS